MPGQTGRPSPIDAVVGSRDIKDDQGHVVDTVPVTVADRIVTLIRNGLYFELACAAGGIHVDTGYEWLKVAGRARIKARGREVDDVELTLHQQRCIAFSDDVLQASGEHAGRIVLLLDTLGRGGIPVVTETSVVKRAIDEDGIERVVERITTTRTEKTLPDASTLRWFLEHRHPDYFGSRIEVRNKRAELLEPSDDERAEDLVESIDAYLKDVAAAAERSSSTDKPSTNGKKKTNGKE